MSQVFNRIREVVTANGLNVNGFRSNVIRGFAPNLNKNTISTFLPKHTAAPIAEGNAYFERISPGLYRIKAMYLM